MNDYYIKGRNSKSRLQIRILKYGNDKFIIVIYYCHNDPAVTDIETEVIISFPFEDLYKKEANSMLGYKHNIKAINKMKLRFKDKTKHPMYGKTQDTLL
jgi:hypothetical protein